MLQGLVFRSFPREHGDDGDHICRLVPVAVIARLDVGLTPALRLQRTPAGGVGVAFSMLHLLLHAFQIVDLDLPVASLCRKAEQRGQLETLSKAFIYTSWYLPSCVILQELASVSSSIALHLDFTQLSCKDTCTTIIGHWSHPSSSSALHFLFLEKR